MTPNRERFNSRRPSTTTSTVGDTGGRWTEGKIEEGLADLGVDDLLGREVPAARVRGVEHVVELHLRGGGRGQGFRTKIHSEQTFGGDRGHHLTTIHICQCQFGAWFHLNFHLVELRGIVLRFYLQTKCRKTTAYETFRSTPMIFACGVQGVGQGD